MPWYRGPYFILSVVLLLAVLSYPLASNVLGAMVLQVAITAMLFGAVYAVTGSRTLFRVMAILLVPTLAINWFADPSFDPWLTSISLFATISMFTITLVAIIAHIVTADKVTTDVIFGSIAAYVLFGVVLALCYHAVHVLEPGSAISTLSERMSNETWHAQFSEHLYFSYVTLTSVGYGDITPVGPAARNLAIFQGIFGQLYVAILIARLVSIHISQK